MKYGVTSDGAVNEFIFKPDSYLTIFNTMEKIVDISSGTIKKIVEI